MKLTYRALENDDIKRVVPLHMESLQGGLLYDMGKSYVGLLYKKGLRSGNSFGFVAENEEKEIVGMAFATSDIYKLVLRLVISPKFLIGLTARIFRIRKLYPSFSRKMHVRQEFLILFIKQEYRNLKAALKLMQLIDAEFERFGIKKYSLEVEAKNRTANALYQYFGFRQIYEVGRGDNKRLFYIKDTGKNGEI